MEKWNKCITKIKKEKKQYRIYFFEVICHEFSSFYQYVEGFINNPKYIDEQFLDEDIYLQSKKLSRSLLAISI